MKKKRENEVEVFYLGTLEVNGECVVRTVDSNGNSVYRLFRECHLKRTYWDDSQGIVEGEFVVTKGEVFDGVQTYDLWSLDTELEQLAARQKWIST